MRYLVNFGQVYGESAYNSSTYQNGTTQSTQVSGSGSVAGSSGTLVNTGFAIVLAVTVACFILFVVALVHFLRRPAKTYRVR